MLSKWTAHGRAERGNFLGFRAPQRLPHGMAGLLHCWMVSPTPSVTLRKLEAMPFGVVLLWTQKWQEDPEDPGALLCIEHRHIHWVLHQASSCSVGPEAPEDTSGCRTARSLGMHWGAAHREKQAMRWPLGQSQKSRMLETARPRGSEATHRRSEAP